MGSPALNPGLYQLSYRHREPTKDTAAEFALGRCMARRIRPESDSFGRRLRSAVRALT
jgi:hypothetical protein